MRDGELLLEVNDESVESLKHEEVVDRVKLSGREVRLTTITPKGLEFYTQVAITYHIRALLFQLIQVYIEGGAPIWRPHLVLGYCYVFPLFSLLQLGLSPLLFCEDDAADEGKESSMLTSVEENSPPKETHASSHLRLCSLQKGPLGFGFKLGCDPQSPGTFISQVLVFFCINTHTQKSHKLQFCVKSCKLFFTWPRRLLLGVLGRVLDCLWVT